MAAFFRPPAPPGRDRASAGPRPTLRLVWRLDADGRLHSRWLAGGK